MGGVSMKEIYAEWIKKKLQHEVEVEEEEIRRWKGLAPSEKDRWLRDVLIVAEMQWEQLKRQGITCEPDAVSREAQELWQRLRERYARRESL